MKDINERQWWKTVMQDSIKRQWWKREVGQMEKQMEKQDGNVYVTRIHLDVTQMSLSFIEWTDGYVTVTSLLSNAKSHHVDILVWCL